MGQMIEAIGLKFQELRDTNQMLMGESFVADFRKAALDFETKLMYDKSYYTSDEKLKALQEMKENYKKAYQDKVKEAGYDEDFMNAYIESADKVYSTANAKFNAKYITWSEEQAKNNFLILQDTRVENSYKYMLNGERDFAVNDYKETSERTIEGVGKDYVNASTAIDSINKNKAGLINAHLLSFVNQEGGEEELSNLGKMNFQEFEEYYKDLEINAGGYDIKLTLDDFEKFQRGINANLNRIKVRKKSEEEATRYEYEKALKEVRDNPVDATLKNMPADIPINQNFEEYALSNINNKYGTGFTNLEEAINMGFNIPTIGKVNSRADYYNDISVPGELMIGNYLNEVNSIVGGQSEKFQMNAVDNMYSDTNFMPGYTGAKLLAQPGSSYARTFANLYSPENKKILDAVKDVKVDKNKIFDMYKDKPVPLYQINPDYNSEMIAGTMPSYIKGVYTEADIGGIITGLETAGQNGDTHSGRLARDINQLVSDYTKTLVFSETGGILSSDLAEELEIKNSDGMAISELSAEKQQKIFNYYTEDPGRLRKLFGSENAYKKQTREDLEKAVAELTKGIQMVDIGEGRFVNIPPDLNGADIAKGVRAKIEEEDFLTENGTTPPKSQIQAIGKPDERKIIFMYNKKPLYTKEGKQVTLFLKEGEKK